MEDTFKHKGLRKGLVETLKGKGIRDERVLNAIGKIPRHFFMDNAFVNHAYQDKAFSIGEGQTISQPYTVAKQTELLEMKPGGSILEIGTGSGYQCAILMAMGFKVTTIETIPSLHKKAKKLLMAMGGKAEFILGDGSLGYEVNAPYDGILVTAGAPEIPMALAAQLKVGAKLIIPVGSLESQMMYKITRTAEEEYQTEKHGGFAFVPLVGEKGWKSSR